MYIELGVLGGLATPVRLFDDRRNSEVRNGKRERSERMERLTDRWIPSESRPRQVRLSYIPDAPRSDEWQRWRRESVKGGTRSLTKSDLTSRSVFTLDNEGKYTHIRALSA